MQHQPPNHSILRATTTFWANPIRTLFNDLWNQREPQYQGTLRGITTRPFAHIFSSSTAAKARNGLYSAGRALKTTNHNWLGVEPQKTWKQKTSYEYFSIIIPVLGVETEQQKKHI